MSSRPEEPASENGKSKKPKDSDFSQQRLKAVHPVLTAGNVMPFFFILGIIFIPVGIGMLVVSEQTKELELDYTDCTNKQGQLCHEVINQTDPTSVCECEVETSSKIGPGWSKDVMVYYGLTNFFQNHRSYVKSRDDSQLLGDIAKKPSDDCKPFQDEGGKPYIPCGAIANSLFSDTIKVQYEKSDGQWSNVSLIRTGIAWEADKNFKFKNPPLQANQTLKDVLLANNYVKPKNWHRDLWELDPENPENNGLQNEDLMVWMRTAALPNFRKLYRRINHTGELENQLPDARFKFVIEYRYDVKTFSGTKSVILSTTSVLGGKNSFLGIAYMVVGGILVALSLIFLYVHWKYGRTMLLTETML